MSDWDSPAPLQEHDGNEEEAAPVRVAAPLRAAEENHKLVEATAWSKPVPYDYAAATGATREERDEAARNARSAELDASGDAGMTADVPLWASNAKKYEWRDEFGDVGPAIPELERQLFDDQFGQRVGENFKSLQVGELKVTVESESEVEPISRWEDAGLHPVMLENIKLCKYSTPTAIQGYTVPAVLTNHDVVAISQTGKYPPLYLRLLLIAFQAPAKPLHTLFPPFPSSWARPRSLLLDALPPMRMSSSPATLIVASRLFSSSCPPVSLPFKSSMRLVVFAIAACFAPALPTVVVPVVSSCSRSRRVATF